LNEMQGQRQAGFLIAKIHHLAGRVFARKLKEHGIEEINPAQGRILFALWQGDGISIYELAKETALSKSTLTSMLDRLEEGGFIVREHSEEDRRKILIWRTEKDRAWQRTYVEVSQDMLDLFYRDFSEGERDAFEGYLERVLVNLQAFEAQGD
jgi:DNA-binding MarR family transcriptional regulator